MWQLILRAAPGYVRYAVLPGAVIVGAAGYYFERWYNKGIFGLLFLLILVELLVIN